MTGLEIWETSNGELTARFYRDLCERGTIGFVAMNLFRACKASDRAKKYRGGIRGHGSFRRMAYDKKQYSLAELCGALIEHGDSLSIRFGWREDPATRFGGDPSWVLYVDLPDQCGQVSFHSPSRGDGPQYPNSWDGSKAAAE